MTVEQIGDVTVGKNVGSVTLNDSPTFVMKIEIQIIAMPCSIVLQNRNSAGYGYFNGFKP
jgi:hypothetical protein